ncbi:hypothetical protein SAMN05216570_4082 [Dyella sp. OK004]|uniref:hypothetical protein n=1 Tax=Dyella sp. OK004 TaxID=1855292 RepID=UPI0008EDB105|nr:hypothetical protein [Dyella sp. OK004]SFS19662.1 hypothetical protein SAMN05216570_4082 [Dyella sp. OK004]
MSHKTLLSTTLLVLGVACAAPVWAGGPPPWAPAHGWRAKHHYTYYPEGEVYYAPDTRMWFWLDGGSWRSGISLPIDFQGYVRTGGISIDLDDERPYVEHTYVVEHYGGRPAHYRDRDDRDRDHGWDRDRGHDRDRGDDRDHDRGHDRDRHDNDH